MTAVGRRARVSVSGYPTGQDDRGTTFVAELDVRISAGWYAYPPGSDEGVPLSVTGVGRTGVDAVELAEPAMAHLEGTVRVVVRGWTAEPPAAQLQLLVQACNGATCEMPESVNISIAVPLL